MEKPWTDFNPNARQQSIADSIFGSPLEQAQAKREESFQNWLNQRRASVEKQRTDDIRMAKYNALGNALTTLVQPLGWAIGGSTAGVQPYDNRQYLEAFNRAVKANEDLRNIGDMEAEYQFKLADENYRRELAIANEERKQQLELDKQKQIFDLRSQLNKEQIEGRIAVAEATAKAKMKFSVNGKKVTESVRDNLIKRANTAYANILADYYKKKQVGIEGLQEPPTYDDFLKQFASENGYNVSEGVESAPATTVAPAKTSTGRTTANLGNITSNSKSGRSTAKL